MLHALVIGIDDYADACIPNVRYASRDAMALAQMLEDRLKRQECQVHRLVNESATRRNIMTTLGVELPRQVQEGDICLVFFAGHGSPETGNSLEDTARYLIAHDTEFANIFSTGIALEHELGRCLERIAEDAVVLLLLDCCFSGRIGGRTFEGPRFKSQRPSFRGHMGISLADINPGKGRAIIAACGDRQWAMEDFELEHGIFSYHLMRLLERPRGAQRTVPIATLYGELAHAVHHHTGGLQVPVMYGHLENAQLPILTP
jgi:uncharacterized caspase-like protein